MNENSLVDLPVVILAAGAARRFGQIKQLMPWGPFTVLGSVIQAAMVSGLRPVYVVLGANREHILPVLERENLQILINEAWEEGQGSSLRLAALSVDPKAKGFITLLGDQPQISPTLIRAVALEGIRSGKVVRPLHGDKRGHPVFFPNQSFGMLRHLTAEQSGRDVVRAYENTLIEWFDEGMSLDMDTPEDYQRLKQAYGLDD